MQSSTGVPVHNVVVVGGCGAHLLGDGGPDVQLPSAPSLLIKFVVVGDGATATLKPPPAGEGLRTPHTWWGRLSPHRQAHTGRATMAPHRCALPCPTRDAAVHTGRQPAPPHDDGGRRMARIGTALPRPPADKPSQSRRCLAPAAREMTWCCRPPVSLPSIATHAPCVTSAEWGQLAMPPRCGTTDEGSWPRRPPRRVNRHQLARGGGGGRHHVPTSTLASPRPRSAGYDSNDSVPLSPAVGVTHGGWWGV